MEKFSQFRDPGTGIQPFLPPLPPVDNSILPKLTLPLRYALGTFKFILILLFAAVYTILVHVIAPFVFRIDVLFYPFRRLVTWICGYPVLWLTGVYYISSEQVSRKKGLRGTREPTESWSPKKGDLIVSNWVSWIELVWLAIHFNPTFVLPICAPVSTPPSSKATPPSSNPITHTPGRRTGTGSANITSSSPSTRTPSPQSDILGYKEVSLLSMIRLTGHTSPFGFSRTEGKKESLESLEEIRKRSKRPVVVFPEGTTSNGRGLLRFTNFGKGVKVPVMDYKVYVMCVRYDPPTTLSPSASLPIPSLPLLTFIPTNPLTHIYTLCTSLSIPPITIRLLAASSSPSSGLFLPSDILSVTDYKGPDELGECCAVLMGQIGKMKRVGMGWEDKAVFLDFYWSVGGMRRRAVGVLGSWN